MKMIAGDALRALRKRSRTRAAPTPTSDSTKSEPDSGKKAASASPATAFASSVLPVPGRADQQHALGRGGADGQVLARIGQVVADLAQLGHRFAGAGDVGERDLVARPLALLAALAGELREAGDPARGAVAAQAHEQREQAHEQQDRDQELDDDRLGALARLLIDADDRAARRQFVESCWVCAPEAG